MHWNVLNIPLSFYINTTKVPSQHHFGLQRQHSYRISTNTLLKMSISTEIQTIKNWLIRRNQHKSTKHLQSWCCLPPSKQSCSHYFMYENTSYFISPAFFVENYFLLKLSLMFWWDLYCTNYSPFLFFLNCITHVNKGSDLCQLISQIQLYQHPFVSETYDRPVIW